MALRPRGIAGCPRSCVLSVICRSVPVVLSFIWPGVSLVSHLSWLHLCSVRCPAVPSVPFITSPGVPSGLLSVLASCLVSIIYSGLPSVLSSVRVSYWSIICPSISSVLSIPVLMSFLCYHLSWCPFCSLCYLSSCSVFSLVPLLVFLPFSRSSDCLYRLFSILSVLMPPLFSLLSL